MARGLLLLIIACLVVLSQGQTITNGRIVKLNESVVNDALIELRPETGLLIKLYVLQRAPAFILLSLTYGPQLQPRLRLLQGPGPCLVRIR